MRPLAKLLASDLRYGLGSAVLGRVALVAAVSLLVFFLSYTALLVKAPELQGRLTLGEGLLCMWRGMAPYSPQSGRPFTFPMAWLALALSSLYVVADYPFRDLGGMGAHLIVACRSRWAWWLAKCGWVVAVALACWLATLALGAVVALASGGGLDLGVRPGVAAVLNAGRNEATGSTLLTHFQLKSCTNLSETEFWHTKKRAPKRKFLKNAILETETIKFG